MRKFIIGSLLAVVALTSIAAEMPPELKGKTVKVVSPATPGGLIDTRVLPLMQIIYKQTGLEMFLANIQGANQGIGTTYVANAKPDGLTIGFSMSGTTVMYDLAKKPTHPSRENYVPFAALYEFVQAVSVPYDAPYDTLDKAIKHVKENKGKLNYAFLNAEAALTFTEMFGNDVVAIPVKNWGQIQTMMKQGDMSFMTSPVGSAIEAEKNKLSRIIAVVGEKRNSALPNIPSLSERFPGFSQKTVIALYAPKNTPPHILKYLNEIVMDANRTPEMLELYAKYNHQPYDVNVEQSRAIIDKEYQRYTKLMKSTNVTLD